MEDEGCSVEALAQRRRAEVFFYQEQKTKPSSVDGLPEDVQPFAIGLMDEDMIRWAVKYGHDRPLIVDGTFGTNSVMVGIFPLSPDSYPLQCLGLPCLYDCANII